MHRFYLPPERVGQASCLSPPPANKPDRPEAGSTLRLEGREAHHALHVLRLKRGERVAVLDGIGNEFLCAVENSLRDAVELRVTRKNFIPPLPCSITLLQAIPKGKIIESIIQKAVELGVRRIVPLLTERVVTRLDASDAADKQEKWRQVAIEAIKQCGAAWLPQIEPPTNLAEVLDRRPETRSESGTGSSPSAFSLSTLRSRATAEDGQPSAFELSLVGSLQKECRHPREVFREFDKNHHHLPESVAVWIGPEGDFTPEELRWIQHSGAQPVSLGPLTLRVETAAIYCLSILNYELGL